MTVTGTLDPDATGDYNYLQQYNGRYAYKLQGNGFDIWWSTPPDEWHISAVLGDIGSASWSRQDPQIEGVYDPMGTATGHATVART